MSDENGNNTSPPPPSGDKDKLHLYEVTPVPEGAEDVNWEDRCKNLERQLAALIEVTALRKRLLEIRENETQNLTAKLKVLSESIEAETASRNQLMKRVEAAEGECKNVKDKLRRNVDALERMRAEHERRTTVLAADLEIAEIKAKGHARDLEESHRVNAELKGRLEELNMKLHENKKSTKRMEKRLKKSNDKNHFLSTQVTLISQLLGEEEESSTSASPAVYDDDKEGSPSGTAGGDIDVKKLRRILKRASNSTEKTQDEEQEPPATEDEGVDVDLTPLDLESDDSCLEDNEASPPIPGEESCYKRVDTSSGPKMILSVSRTFIKLKDLILEKRSLQTQIDGLKSFNTKLETKVDKQEHRLYCVTKELNKTWSLVSKLKMQQDKLHSSEAFLRYELKENRAIVVRLRKEMESYKEKWGKVRAKNTESQEAWQQLKDEFAERRKQQQQEQESLLTQSQSPSPPQSPVPTSSDTDADVDPTDGIIDEESSKNATD